MKNTVFEPSNIYMAGGITIFGKIITVIFIIYGLVLILNFLRDKFSLDQPVRAERDYLNLLLILNKLFVTTGFGFVLVNILSFFLNNLTKAKKSSFPQITGNFDYLIFGIIIIFIGIGLKQAVNLIKKSAK